MNQERREARRLVREKTPEWLAKQERIKARKLAQAKRWYHENKAARAAYRKSIPGKTRRDYNRKWYARKGRETMARYRQNPRNRMMINLRRMVRDFLGTKKFRKKSRSLRLLGCTPDELRTHIESQFLSWMTWENYGKRWQIDHRLPCASFDLTDERQQEICFHYTNLQPMCRSKNSKKGARITDPQIRLRISR